MVLLGKVHLRGNGNDSRHDLGRVKLTLYDFCNSQENGT